MKLSEQYRLKTLMKKPRVMLNFLIYSCLRAKIVFVQYVMILSRM